MPENGGGLFEVRFPFGVVGCCLLPVVHAAAIFGSCVLDFSLPRPGDIVEVVPHSRLGKVGRAKAHAVVVANGGKHSTRSCVIRNGEGAGQEGSIMVLGTQANGDYVVHWQSGQDTGDPQSCGRSADLLVPARALYALRQTTRLEHAAEKVLSVGQSSALAASAEGGR